jgi:hypothetical protein
MMSVEHFVVAEEPDLEAKPDPLPLCPPQTPYYFI